MPGGSKKGGGLEYAPFKMKGSPMKRNFGIGEKESPFNKKSLWESLGFNQKFKDTKLAKDIKSAGAQVEADITRVGEYLKTGKATTPRKVAKKSGGPGDHQTLQDKRLAKKSKGKTPSKRSKRTSKVDWSTAPKNNTQARRDWYTKHNLAQDATTVVK